jgi:hypothetical protein
MKSKRGRSLSKDNAERNPKTKHAKRLTSHNRTSTSDAASSNNDNKSKQGQEHFVHHISKFLLGSKSNTRENCIDSGSSSRNEQTESVLFLVKQIESFQETTQSYSDATITKEDIAALLLPWSVARLVRSTSDSAWIDKEDAAQEVVWRTLSSCLDILSNNAITIDTVAETTLSNSLSQSTLAKLIIAAASLAFYPQSSSETQVQEYASNVFLKLTKRYRPSFEVACNTLLKQIEDLVYPARDNYPNDADSNFIKMLPKHQYAVVYGALQMIQTLLGGANVKRSFSMLSSAEMLPRLGRLGFVQFVNPSTNPTVDKLDGGEVMSLVENIIRDGLFHQVHHMDGFRTMEELRGLPTLPMLDDDRDGTNGSLEKQPKSGGKGCYQSGLFNSLRVLLSGASLNDKDSSNTADTVAATNLLPVLIRGFFEGIQTKQQMNNNIIQFYFWAHATIETFKQLFQDFGSNANLDMSLLKMTTETLNMVLDRDAYSPSYHDPDEALLSFLKFVTRGLLRCIETSDSASFTNEKILSYLLSSIRALLLLNHRLLHEQLPRCIAFACSNLHQYHNDDLMYSYATTLLTTIVKTYSELRQVGYFLSSTRNAFVYMQTSKNDSVSMHSLLLCRDVMELLATSYQTLPSGQLQELWDFLDRWIADPVNVFKNESDSLTCHASNELHFATCMFILYIKSIRADKHNSAELRKLCEKTMASSVAKLLDHSKETQNTKQGIDLCGWLVELHTRSCFCIDNIVGDGDGSAFLLAGDSDDSNTFNVLSYLRETAKETIDSDDFRLWTASWKQTPNIQHPIPPTEDGMASLMQPPLLRLALHRIQQLHSMIYYCKVQEHNVNEVNESKCTVSSAELTSEAKLLVNYVIYTAETFCKPSCLTSESKTMWSTVAKSLSTWSCYAEQFHMSIFLSWFFSTLSHCDDEDVLLHDNDCVLTLVRDASFYNIKECMSLLVQDGVYFAIRKLLSCLTFNGSDECRRDFLSVGELLSKPTGLAAALAQEVQSSSLSLNESTNMSIKSIVGVTSFLSSAPLDLLSCNQNIELIDVVVGLDILISRICEMARESDSFLNSLFKLLSSSRYLLSSLLPRTTLSADQKSTPLLLLTSEHVIRTSIWFNESYETLRATGNVMSELYTLCIDYCEKNNNLLSEFLSRLNDITSVSTITASPMEFGAHAFLMRSVIRRMNIINHRRTLSKDHHAVDVSSLCLKKMWGKIIDSINNRKSSQSHMKAGAMSLLLASDLLACLGNSKSTAEEDKARECTTEIFHLVASDNDSSPDLTAAWHYFLSSILTIKNISRSISPVTALSTTLLKAIEKTDSPLLESSLCSLLRESTVDGIKFVVSYLSSKDITGKSRRRFFTAKIYNLMIHCVKSQEEIKYLSDQSLVILLTSMSLLQDEQGHGSHDEIVSNVVLFSAIMSSLISRKDLLLLSGREITMICCEMSAMFKKQETNNTTNDVTIFKSCCSVVSSLVTNYSKQLYGCPTGLFSFLLALLDNILQSNPTNGLDGKSLEYAK